MTSVTKKQEALLDALLKEYTNPQDILGEHGLPGSFSFPLQSR